MERTNKKYTVKYNTSISAKLKKNNNGTENKIGINNKINACIKFLGYLVFILLI